MIRACKFLRTKHLCGGWLYDFERGLSILKFSKIRGTHPVELAKFPHEDGVVGPQQEHRAVVGQRALHAVGDPALDHSEALVQPRRVNGAESCARIFTGSFENKVNASAKIK